VWPEFSDADAAAIAARTEGWNRHWNDRWIKLAIEDGLIPKDWAIKQPREKNPDLQALYVKSDQQKTAFWPRLVAKMPNARLEVIRNAGHSIWMDEPEQFAQTLRGALNDATGS
jgi:pimeloyl-ACP methyl ester carboxylesterase